MLCIILLAFWEDRWISKTSVTPLLLGATAAVGLVGVGLLARIRVK